MNGWVREWVDERDMSRSKEKWKRHRRRMYEWMIGKINFCNFPTMKTS